MRRLLPGPRLGGRLVRLRHCRRRPRNKPVQAKPISTFPPVKQDLAFTVPDTVSAHDLGEAIRDAAGDMLESIELFDVYTGDQVGEGKKSLAYAVTFRARWPLVCRLQGRMSRPEQHWPRSAPAAAATMDTGPVGSSWSCSFVGWCALGAQLRTEFGCLVDDALADLLAVFGSEGAVRRTERDRIRERLLAFAHLVARNTRGQPAELRAISAPGVRRDGQPVPAGLRPLHLRAHAQCAQNRGHDRHGQEQREHERDDRTCSTRSRSCGS